MKNIVKMKEFFLKGSNKICVPLMGKSEEEILNNAKQIHMYPAQIVEWRIDTYKDCKNFDMVTELVGKLKEVLVGIPLLGTFRTHKEGGNTYISKEEYVNLLDVLITKTEIDVIDIEYFFMEVDELKKTIEKAHKNNVLVIGSNHDFEKTPNTHEIYSRLKCMYDIGMDVSKIAVMPKCKMDVIRLLKATCEINEEYEDIKTITMSMGEIGTISRIVGGDFGNVMTFGTAKKASAPGQMDSQRLRNILDIL